MQNLAVNPTSARLWLAVEGQGARRRSIVKASREGREDSRGRGRLLATTRLFILLISHSFCKFNSFCFEKV